MFDSATSWTAAYQAPPSMGFSRQEYWSRVPSPSLTRLLSPWDFPGKSTGVGCHSHPYRFPKSTELSSLCLTAYMFLYQHHFSSELLKNFIGAHSVRKIRWRREWQPTSIFLPGKSSGQRSLVGYTVHGVTKSQTQWK